MKKALILLLTVILLLSMAIPALAEPEEPIDAELPEEDVTETVDDMTSDDPGQSAYTDQTDPDSEGELSEEDDEPVDVSTEQVEEKSDLYIWFLVAIAAAVVAAGLIVRIKEKKVRIQKLDRSEEQAASGVPADEKR